MSKALIIEVGLNESAKKEQNPTVAYSPEEIAAVLRMVTRLIPLSSIPSLEHEPETYLDHPGLVGDVRVERRLSVVSVAFQHRIRPVV